MKAISELAARQFGALSRTQALTAGLSSSGIARRLQARAWRPVDDGVYVVDGTTASWLQQVMIATLATRGLASHLTAGRLWKLVLPRGSTAVTDVIVAAERRPRSTKVIRVHRARADVESWRVEIDGIPASDLGHTLLQLSEVLSARELELAVDSASAIHPSILFWLADTLVASRRGHTSSVVFRELLSELLSDGTLDQDVAALLKANRLTPTFRNHLGVDFVWMPQRVVLQTFNHVDHGRGAELDALIQQGYDVLITHDREVKSRPKALIERLKARL